MNVLKRIRGLLFDNFGWKAVSLLIAVVIWAMVASEPELSATATAIGGLAQPDSILWPEHLRVGHAVADTVVPRLAVAIV